MRRLLFEPEHEVFRRACRAFCDREIAPYHDDWERAGIVPRELWTKAGAAGLLGFAMPAEYGGTGVDDYRFNVVLDEELARVGASGVGIPVHNDIVGGYLRELATPEQQARWLPGFCDGTTITAIAMTEPAAGSDLRGMQTTARRDDDTFVVTGQKTFISNGFNADLVVLAARSEPAAEQGAMSLLVVERGMPGFRRGRNLDKVGLKAQDTAELFFDQVRVPAANLLGGHGEGFSALMRNLPRERLSIAVGSVAACERILDLTLAHVRERQAFGRPIGRFQANAFTLAELCTQVDVARAYVDRCVQEHTVGSLSPVDAAKAKWWTTELHKRLVDSCVQLFGGYGTLADSPVAKAFLDARVRTIYGGTTEVMKHIIARSLEL
jgi:alkylation response protein AidB-like acyl-CoA dehydrogenase